MPQTRLTRAAIEAHDPEGGRGGRWLCPLQACADHTDKRRHRSLNLDASSGLWKCHRCGAGGQVEESWKPMTPRRSWEERRERERQERERRRAAALSIVAPRRAPATPNPETFRLGSLRRLGGTPGASYLAGRGLALDLCHAAGVRFAPDFWRRPAEEGRPATRGAAAVVFPIRGQGGRLVAAQGRFLAPLRDGSKMRTHGPKSAGVFATPGALAGSGPVAVVEAPIDALSLATAGLPAVALCGTSGAPDWLLDALVWRPVLLAFDADPPKDGEPGAGDRAAAAFAAELARVSLGRAAPVRLRPPQGLKDWNDVLRELGPEGLRRVLADRLPANDPQTVRPAPALRCAPVTDWKRNAPAGGPARPVQGPHPQDGEDVPPEAPESPHGEILTGAAADAALRRLGLWDQLHPTISDVAGDPLPDLALLEERQPWPACDGLTAIGAKRWAARLVVTMVARGRTRAQCADLAGFYGLALDDVLREALAKQEQYRHGDAIPGAVQLCAEAGESREKV